MINLQLSGTVRTLILTLRARAEEQQRETPLLNDQWSADWYKFMPDSKALNAWYNPNFQLATVIRSRLIDEATEAFLEKHDDALVVEMGAGFSTRYFRLGQGRSTWIELDLEDAIVARRKLDLEVDDHWFIASDMTDLDWLDSLPEKDPKNILFIAEGTLMFADPDGVENLFDVLSERFAGATFVFDVVNPDYMATVNEQFKELSAPMQWAVHEHDLANYNLKINDTGYILLEFTDRWDEIGVDASKRTQDRSGYVIASTLG